MALGRIRSLLTGQRAGPVFEAPMAPGAPVYVVGDIHGRADLIEPLMQRIDQDSIDNDYGAPRLVFVGDYVDRGEHSAAVLNHVRELNAFLPEAVICLRGNHEQMMLDFLDDPASWGGRWVRNGGLQTLASFGIGGLSERATMEELIAASAAFERALPEGMEAWLRNLPYFWATGNVVCTHAAMDPSQPPDMQSRNTMLWGHEDFHRTARMDETWVVHGHTIVPEPAITAGRIAIDTGAYYSGILTAAAIAPDRCDFLSTIL